MTLKRLESVLRPSYFVLNPGHPSTDSMIVLKTKNRKSRDGVPKKNTRIVTVATKVKS